MKSIGMETKRQFPKELDKLNISEKMRVIEEVQKIHNIELAEEKQFFDRIDRVFDSFSKRGFSDDVSVQLTIAFLNDPVFQKKRAKRKIISEIIDSVTNN